MGEWAGCSASYTQAYTHKYSTYMRKLSMSGRGIGNHSEAVGRRLAGLGEGLHLGIRGRGRIAMTAWLREVYAAFDKKGGLSAAHVRCPSRANYP